VKSPYVRYQEIQSQMRAMLTARVFRSEKFDDLWCEMESLKNQFGGFPPPNPDDDEQAREMELCESANERGLR